MAAISAIAARQFSFKTSTGVTDTVKHHDDPVIVMLPDGSIRFFDDASTQIGEHLTGQTVLSEYPDMHLTSAVSVVSPTTPLVPGESYFLAPKRAAPKASTIRPPPRRSSVSREGSPILPPTRRSLRAGVASSSDAIPLARNVHRHLRATVETTTRISSPGSSNVRSELETSIAESEFSFVTPKGLGNRRRSFCSSREVNADEDSINEGGLFKSKTYSGRKTLKNMTSPVTAIFERRQIDLSPLRGENCRSRVSSNNPSPASSVSSVTSQRHETKPPRPPSPLSNPILAEIAALDEECCDRASTPSTATTRTTFPPSSSEGSSRKSNVLATLAQFAPRSLRRFASAGEKKLQPAFAAANGADAVAAMKHSASESALDWADADSRLFMMTDTRIRRQRSPNVAGSAQHGSRTNAVQPSADFAVSPQPQRSPSITTSLTTEWDVPLSSSICRSCHGMSNYCSCEVQCAASTHLDSPQLSQGPRRHSLSSAQRIEMDQCDATLAARRISVDGGDGFAMTTGTPSSQRFLSGPLAPRSIF